MNCNICPRMCNIDRNKSFGFCKKNNKIQVSKVMLHYGEEPFLTNDGGASGAIFFAGCNLKCVYCQNYEISHGNGKYITIKTLVSLFKQLEQAGACNIDLVTPTHYTNLIYKALKIYKPKIPVIYNCGGYETQDTINKMSEVIDIFLFDLKYYNNDIAIKYSLAPNYFNYASKSIELAIKLKPTIVNNGYMSSGVVVRHLCLPGQVQDSKKVLDYLSTLSKDVRISLMSQYTPAGEANKFEEINRTLKPIEYKTVVNHALKLGLTNILTQDLNSATAEMIPDFKAKDNFIY